MLKIKLNNIILLFSSLLVIGLNGQVDKPNDNTFTPEVIWWAALRDFKNSRANDYGDSPQNWIFIERPESLIYIAHSTGVVEYGGNSQRIIELSSSNLQKSSN